MFTHEFIQDGLIRVYVIWNHDERKYVAPPGQAKSFTHDLRKARKFKTKEEAERECCGNERVEGWRMSERFA